MNGLKSIAVVVAMVAAAFFAWIAPKGAHWEEEATPMTVTYFETSPPGAQLPTGELCASRIRANRREPRPQNKTPNNTTGHRVSYIDGANEEGQRKYALRIDGEFTGTSDELIQWAACKWGLHEDVVRAVAVSESNWDQLRIGDDGEVGILQVKCTVHKAACPGARYSTALNLDYALAWRRSCFEGYFQHWVPAEARGDEWGCVGLWYSGNWKTGDAEYVASVKRNLAERAWLRDDF